ncbi:MAG: hypothetical protein ACRD3K_00815 [Edaphobacter sp.]
MSTTSVQAPSATPMENLRVAIGRPPVVIILLWVLIFAAVPISAMFSPSGWDVAVYRNAIHSLKAGHDPYLDDISAQKVYYSQAVRPVGDPPFNYVYSPMTLPLLRLIGSLPIWLSGSLYWLAYIVGVLAGIWVGTLALEDNERRYFLYFAPVTIFFHGLIANGIVLGGNIAYILYGLVLLAAVLGWRRGTWMWFYLAVIAASCVKAPLLCLTIIPLLSARKQWIPASVTAVAGVALFAVTPVIWPTLFKHYLQSLQLEFNYNHDFGSSPAGLFSDALHSRGIAYSPACIFFYLAYAIPTFALLFYLSRRFLQGSFSLRQWMPVLLLGVMLLNPRLIEYDLAPITLLLALIAWRFLATFTTPLRIFLCLALLLVATNFIALQSWELGKLTQGPLLVIYFTVGCVTLLKRSHIPAEVPMPAVAA